MIRLIACCSVALLTACASRLSEYPGHFAATTRGVEVEGSKFVVQQHETESMLMVTPTILGGIGAGLASGVTMGAMDGHDVAGARNSVIARAGLMYLGDRTCTITNVEAFGSVSYELSYECTARQH